jgi:hypothetical protein
MSTPQSRNDEQPGSAALEGQEPGRPRGRLRLGHTLAATGLLGLLIGGSALAAKGDALREAVRNGTATGETEIIGDVAASTAQKGGFVTRQSNIDTGADAGGAAIYGCRAPLASPESCLRASNLTDGEAFSFATKGDSAGSFQVGSSTGAPFTTNGGGLVQNLNADKVDGKDADELGGGATGPAGPAGPAGAVGPVGPAGADAPERLFAVVEEDGSVRAQRGLTSTAGVRIGPGFYTLEFDRDVTSCAVVGSQGARNNGFAGGRIISVGKAVTPAGAEGNVNVRIQMFSGGAFVDENQPFDVQVVC